ncbi:hypothetical protein DERF_010874 [Dermatophagoides farinae]|uniref:Uncharacterized protein n=1 Tax=Dermatophagoides farinae TaxID=6954 RepID=A0A922HRS8_DERFA|nr:hypothetical protein DERF_010874 [Dermatophagoides farinae]
MFIIEINIATKLLRKYSRLMNESQFRMIIVGIKHSKRIFGRSEFRLSATGNASCNLIRALCKLAKNEFIHNMVNGSKQSFTGAIIAKIFVSGIGKLSLSNGSQKK